MRKLNTLNTEELSKVFEVNKKLQNKIFNNIYKDADHWCEEYLSCWDNKAIDYCIGYDRGTYFVCKNRDLFLDGLKIAQKDYCFLDDKYDAIIERAENLVNDMLTLDCYSDDYEKLDNEVSELIDKLTGACYQRFMDEYDYCYDVRNQKDYFRNVYLDYVIDDRDFYIDDDYVLYEHIEYEKCYK